MSTKTKTAKADVKPKPAANIQVGGVRIPIWQNESEKGRYFRAGKPELSYKAADETWKQSESYSDRDLLNLIKAAALAHSEVSKLNRAVRADEAAEETEDLAE
jgi:hypothetical protein